MLSGCWPCAEFSVIEPILAARIDRLTNEPFIFIMIADPEPNEIRFEFHRNCAM